MALFGSGPRSNILQIVSPMYQGIIDAEKQKGLAMREAMGAFGKAIDPKTIAMRKFRQQFGNLTEEQRRDPNVLRSMAATIVTEDPQAATGLLQMAQALQPKSPSIESRYEAVTESGREIRVGETDQGISYELTERGPVPINEPFKKKHVVQKTQVVKSPETVASEARKGVLGDAVWKEAENTMTKIGRARGLMEDVQAGNSKSIPVFVRTMSEMYNADSRAQSEIDKLEKTGTIDQKFFDAIKSGTVGGLTADTIDQYVDIMNAAEDSAILRMSDLASREYRGYTPQFDDPTALGVSLTSLLPTDRVIERVTNPEHVEGMVLANPENPNILYKVSSGHYIRIK